MKSFLKLPLLLSVFFFCNSMIAQNQQKTDSILSLIKNSDNDTIKASNYIALTNLTLYNNPTLAKNYIENSLRLYKKTNNKKGLANSYYTKADYFRSQTQYDSTHYYYNQALNTSLSIGDTLSAAITRHRIGAQYIIDGKLDDCLKIMDMNIPIFERYNDSISLGNVYLIKAQVADMRGYTNIALKENLKALKIHQNANAKSRIAMGFFIMGSVYLDMKQHEKALEFFIKNYKLHDELGNDLPKAQTLNYIGKCYSYLNLLDLAEENFQKGLQLSEKLGYKANIARSYVSIGYNYFKAKDYDKAIENLQKGGALWRALNSPYDEADALVYLGEIFMDKNNYAKAIDYFNQSITVIDTIDSPYTLKRVYKNRSIAFEKLGKFKAALYDHQKSKTFSDTIFNIERTRAVEELNTLYETEKKEQEIVLQQNEIELLEQKAKVNDLQRLLLGSGFILFVITFGLVWYSLRQKVKRNRLEKEKLSIALEYKKKELTTHALHIAKKNEVLDNLKQKAEELQCLENTSKGYQQLIRTINFNLKDDNHWENFARYFEEVHKDFNTNIKQQFPDVTPNELRLIALLKMNLSSKEIANILSISADGVKKARQRLRKKMQLSPKDSLETSILEI